MERALQKPLVVASKMVLVWSAPIPCTKGYDRTWTRGGEKHIIGGAGVPKTLLGRGLWYVSPPLSFARLFAAL